MFETEPGSRARFAELFDRDINMLSRFEDGFKELEQIKNEATSALAEAQKGFLKHPLYKRILARFSSLFGRSTLYSPVLLATENANTAKDEWHTQALRTYSLERSLGYYGGNLPGKHHLLELGYDAGRNQFDLRFLISAGGRFVESEGAFDKLRYKTTQAGKIALRIPKTDSLAPVVYIPNGHIITIHLTGYDGPGSYDRYQGLAQWKPVPNSTPTPVDSKEFVVG